MAGYRYLVHVAGQRPDGSALTWTEVLISREPLSRRRARGLVVWALEVEHRTRLGVQSCTVTATDPRLRAAAAGAKPMEAAA